MKSRGVNVDRIFKTISANKSAQTSIVLAGYSPLGKNSAKLILSSGSQISLDDARNFVFQKFNHTLLPFNSSYTTGAHRNMCTASIIVYRNSVKTRMEAKGLVQINANSYLDTELGEVWESKEVEGTKMFVRENTDEINKVLSDLNMTAASMFRVEAAAFRQPVETNNVIEFFAKSKDAAETAVGVVAGVSEDTLDVLVGSATISIPRDAMIRVISATSVDEVVDYLVKAYPNNPEYAALIKNMM